MTSVSSRAAKALEPRARAYVRGKDKSLADVHEDVPCFVMLRAISRNIDGDNFYFSTRRLAKQPG